jgi:hypothetical protein
MGQTVAEPSPPVAIAEPLPDVLAGTAAPPAVADGQADDLLSQLAGAEIDRMLAAADVEPPPPAAPAPPLPPPPAAAVAPPPTPAPAIAEVAPPPPPPEPVVDLNAVLSDAAAARPTAEAGSLDLSGPADTRLPLLLRPLVLLSAPLDRFPDAVRILIGKVAVVTLLNAAAVLVYVLMFRRHG